MEIRKHPLVLGLALALGASGPGVALAQGMPDTQAGQGSVMMGSQSGYGQGMGPGMMMGGQGGYGPGMGPGMMGPSMMGPGMMGSGMMPCPMMGGAGMGMMQQLLDPEQRSEMRELMQEQRQEQLERMGEMMNRRDDLMALMQEARPDPDEIQALHGQMAELHGEMLADRVRHHNALNDLLTDEQREQLQQAMPEGITPEDHESHH